jgi:hypothetical protein
VRYPRSESVHHYLPQAYGCHTRPIQTTTLDPGTTRVSRPSTSRVPRRIQSASPTQTAIARRASGIRYAAYSGQKPLPIVITITRANAKYYYRVDGPENLAHVSEGRCDVAGDRWESEATTKAFESLKSGRTWRLREEMFAERARGVARGEFRDDAPPPKLPITIRTTSPTFAQLGEYRQQPKRTNSHRGKPGSLVPVIHHWDKYTRRSRSS